MKLRNVLLGTAGIGMLYGFWWATRIPPDVVQGESARIFSVHVPTAWLAFLAFGVTALCGVVWLIKQWPRADHMAAASAEIGVLFTALAILTGMIWGKLTWGFAWDWGDARLASTAMMFFVYVGYLALRRATPDPIDRARRSSVLGAFAALQIPLVYFSVLIWRTLHQGATIRPDGASMPTESLISMLVNLSAFTVLYVGMLLWRTQQIGIEEAQLVSDPSSQTARTAVVAPSLKPSHD